MIRTNDFLLAGVIFCVALIPRMIMLSSPSLGTDEVKWIERGDRLVSFARKGEVLRATAHLMHPGVPPAAAIGIAGRVARKLSIDPVIAARLPQTLLGAATPPLLYLTAATPFGRGAAALAAGFLTFDPRHLAVSRTAHLDVIFALFYLAGLSGLICPMGATGKYSTLVGGVGFGLAMASRTTAAVIVPTWIAWSAFAAARWRRPPFPAREGWLLLLALAVFVLTFGKLWLPAELIPRSARYPQPNEVTEWIKWVETHQLLVSFAGIALLASGAFLRLKRSGPLLALFGASLLGAAWAPNLIINLAGFAANLLSSPERLHHNYYGRQSLPPPGGFLSIIADGLPLPVLIGLGLGLITLTLRAARNSILSNGGAPLLVVLGILTFLLVGAEIPKVAFRYLMPIMPLLMLASACGWMALLRPLGVRMSWAGAIVLSLLVAVLVLPAGPHYATWTSTIGQKIRQTIGADRPFSFEGHEQASVWLWQNATPNDRITAICYDDVLQYYWHEVIPIRIGVPPRPIRIGWFPLAETDFIVLSARRRSTVGQSMIAFLAEREPALSVTVDGETVMEIYDLRRERVRTNVISGAVQPNTSAANAASVSYPSGVG